MGEVVGIIASLGTLAAAGFQSAKFICAIIDELGEAAAKIQGIATDLKAVCLILRGLKNHIQTNPDLSQEAQDVAREIINLCKADIADIQRFIGPLLPSSGTGVDPRSKLKWIVAKGKVASRRASLDSLKLTLQLFILTLEFMKSGDMEDFVKEEVEMLIIQSQSTKTVLLNAEQTDRETSLQPEQPTDTLQVEYDEASTEVNGMEITPFSRSKESSMDKIEPLGGAHREIELAKPNPIPGSSHPMKDIPDDDFVQIAQHIRVQTIVRRLAMWVIYPRKGYGTFKGFVRSDTAPTPEGHNFQDVNADIHNNNDTTEMYAKHARDRELEAELTKSKTLLLETEQEVQKLQAQLDQFRNGEEIGKLREKLQQIRFAEEEKQEQDKRDRYMKEAEELARVRLEKVLRAEAEAKAAAEKKAQLEAEMAEKATAELRKQIEEETKAALEEAAKNAEQLPIKFKDAVGRKFSFPFHKCAKWQGMEELIKQAFLQVDVIGPHVQEGHYDLIGPDGEIILPSVWENVIQPDTAITMTMWPMDKLPPPVAGRARRPPVVPNGTRPGGNPPTGGFQPQTGGQPQNGGYNPTGGNFQTGGYPPTGGGHFPMGGHPQAGNPPQTGGIPPPPGWNSARSPRMREAPPDRSNVNIVSGSDTSSTTGSRVDSDISQDTSRPKQNWFRRLFPRSRSTKNAVDP